MTKTVTEQTVHGEITYQTVACDSCGQDVMEDEANKFTIGNREGYACDVCVEEGPAGFPQYEPEKSVALGVIMWPIFGTFSLLEWHTDEIAFHWAVSTLGALVWLGSAFILLVIA